jgi:carbonic anhydrase
MTNYGASVPISFEASQFHFHSPSEHTIDGKYYDLEMHTVHLDKNEGGTDGFIAAALGIMFSVDDFTAQLSAPE